MKASIDKRKWIGEEIIR